MRCLANDCLSSCVCVLHIRKKRKTQLQYGVESRSIRIFHIWDKLGIGIAFNIAQV